MMELACFTCSKLMGCPLLAGKKGVFNPDNVVRVGGTCTSWNPIDQRQKDVRDSLYGIQGEGCIRVLHQVPSIIMGQLGEEGADEMELLGAMPDLAGMLHEGMSTVEREEQLRYETDEQGQVLYDELDGTNGIVGPVKRPRPSYQLRKFACDVDGHILLDHSVGMFWTTDRVIKYIVAVEMEQGLITKPKKSKNNPAPKAETTETNMAKEGRRVLVNRGGKGAGVGPKPVAAGPKPAGAKVGKPPARRGAKPVQAAAPAPEAEPEPMEDVGGNGSSDPGEFDVQALLQDIQVAVGETVARAVDEAKKEILDKINKARKDNLDGLALLQDRLTTTQGSMQWVDEAGNGFAAPPLYGLDQGILEHIDGLDEPLPK